MTAGRWTFRKISSLFSSDLAFFPRRTIVGRDSVLLHHSSAEGAHTITECLFEKGEDKEWERIICFNPSDVEEVAVVSLSLKDERQLTYLEIKSHPCRLCRGVAFWDTTYIIYEVTHSVALASGQL